MQLGDALCCIVPKLNEWRNHYFCCAKISSVKEEFFYFVKSKEPEAKLQMVYFGANSKKGVR